MNVQQFLSQYWGLISCFLGGILYVTTHYKVSLAYAKKKALSYMLLIEKQAENYAVTEGEAKKDWVTQNAYDFLPGSVRLVVSKPMFQLLVQEVFDSVIGLAKKEQAKQAQNNVAPVSPVPSTQPEIKPAVDVNAILKDVPMEKIREYVAANTNGVQQ